MRGGGASHRSPIRVPYWLLSPSLIPLTVVVFIPMAFAFYISLTGLNQNTIGDWTHAPFVGLKHYVDGLDPRGPLAPSFYSSIKPSVVFSVATPLFILPIAVCPPLLPYVPLSHQSLYALLHAYDVRPSPPSGRVQCHPVDMLLQFSLWVARRPRRGQCGGPAGVQRRGGRFCPRRRENWPPLFFYYCEKAGWLL